MVVFGVSDGGEVASGEEGEDVDSAFCLIKL